MYQDSQESNVVDPGPGNDHSQDLFDNSVHGTEVAHRYCCDGCKENNRILKENSVMLKELLAEMKTIKEGPAKVGKSLIFRIEKTDMEKPLTDYLKSRFPKTLFLNDQDPELKAKLMSLKRKYAPDADGQEVISVGLRFASRKMVDFRSQTKNKMLNKKPEADDLGAKSLKKLTDALFGRFSQCPDMEAKENMAVVIRAFCHSKKQLKKQDGEVLPDFWSSFKDFLQQILEDDSFDKWKNLKDREEKRIERYNRE